MGKIVLLVLWFFIIYGAIIVTKMCLWEIDQKDITSVLVGSMILFTTWFTLGYEAIKTIKKILNK
jgi:hypothetical protein